MPADRRACPRLGAGPGYTPSPEQARPYGPSLRPSSAFSFIQLSLGFMSLIFRGSAPPCTTLPECHKPASVRAMVWVGLSAWPRTPMQHLPVQTDTAIDTGFWPEYAGDAGPLV